MSSDDAVFAALAGSGIPGTYAAWAEGQGPPLPWFTYEREDGGEVFADGGNFAELPRYRAELHLAEPDDGLREAFERAVAAIGPRSRSDRYDAESASFVHEYRFSATRGADEEI